MSDNSSSHFSVIKMFTVYKASNWNNGGNVITFQEVSINGGGLASVTFNKNPNTLPPYVYKLYRIKASA